MADPEQMLTEVAVLGREAAAKSKMRDSLCRVEKKGL